MSESEPIENRPADRRQFFRLGLGQLLKPLAEYIEQRFPLPVPRTVLRPPGALPEKEFLEACYRCGNCTDVCPVEAIRLLQSRDPEISGTPYIDPDIAGCTVCEGIECTKACPSGALEFLTDRHEIRMGLARVRQQNCLRSRGDPCTVCLVRCPLGEVAIRLDDRDRVRVEESGCVGCGLCQQHCPASPKAIVVTPY